MGISPTIGPVTGNTLCEIKGMGFTSVRGDVTVRFACVKGYEEGTNGSVVDDATLLVETPNYETFGPLDVEIRVAIGSKPLTNSKVSASYFSVTDANQCLAFGPGLVNGVQAGTECQICIQAKDFTGTDRTCGMDEFSIRIEPPPPDDAAKELDEAAILEQSKSAEGYNELFAIEPQVTAEEELKVLVMLSDEGDGTYIAEFEPTVKGEYKVYIEFNGTFDGPAGPIRGSPFTFVAQEAYQYVEAHPKDFTYLEGADPDQRALNEINSFDGPLLIADIVAKIKNIRDFAGKKKRGLAKLDPQNYDDMGPWTEVLESVEPKVKAITPTTIHFAEKTMEAMCAYEEAIQKMDTDSRADKCFTLACGSEDAFKMLDKYAKDFEKDLKTLEHNANLCAVFEFPEKIDTARGVLETMIQLIDDQRDAWAVAEDVAGFIGTSQAMLWRELVIEDIEDGSKAQLKKLSGLKKTVKKTGLYVDVS